jgi:hypothetical protein
MAGNASSDEAVPEHVGVGWPRTPDPDVPRETAPGDRPPGLGWPATLRLDERPSR